MVLRHYDIVLVNNKDKGIITDIHVDLSVDEQVYDVRLFKNNKVICVREKNLRRIPREYKVNDNVWVSGIKAGTIKDKWFNLDKDEIIYGVHLTKENIDIFVRESSLSPFLLQTS